ncbi:MAG: hypothetical protein J6S67_22320 [Methanobrevibacter sp.]|nr:hypothetical protein [Methanobrevibacter sp.]
MATSKYAAHLDLNKNEIQNVKGQKLNSTPQGVEEAQYWYDSVNHTMKFYNGTNEVDMGSQGAIYTEGNGIDITNEVISIDNSVTAATKCKVTYNAQGLVTAGADLVASDIPDLSATYLSATLKGANNGVAELDSTGKVPTAQLPSFVDDVIDSYIVSGATPLTAGWLSATDGGGALTPETGKIYVVLTAGDYQNKTYRWSGSIYVEISASPAQATESAAGIAQIATQSEVNTGTNDTDFVTPLKLATYISNKKATFTNPALTASGGQVTWTISTTLAPDCIVTIRETSGGAEVYADIAYGSGSITVKMNSSDDVSAGVYTAVVLG